MKVTFNNYEYVKFKAYLGSIEYFYESLRKARTNSLAREYHYTTFDEIKFLLLYLDCAKWFFHLENKVEKPDHFLQALKESIFKHVEDDIKHGDSLTIEIFKDLLPKIYLEFVKNKDKSPHLWSYRAQFGGFYELSRYWLSNSDSDIPNTIKERIRQLLHQGIIKWLLVAIENEDDEHIKYLSIAARNLVFPDGEIVLSKEEGLIAQHFIFCGKILHWMSEKQEERYKTIFKLLFFNEYNDIYELNFDFNQLVNFYSIKRNGNHSDFTEDFKKYDLEENTLTGSAFEDVTNTFSGSFELDYTFIYLALRSIEKSCQMIEIPHDLSSWNLKAKTESLGKLSNKYELGLNIYVESKGKFETWLDSCNLRYKEQKKRGNERC